MPCPQRSNAARVRKLNRFNGGKLPGNSKHLFKTSKDKAVPGKRGFKRWVSVEKFLFVYLWLNRLVLCFVTVFPAKLSYELRSVNALNMFELIQIFKAVTAGCDVGFCVWPRWRCHIFTAVKRKNLRHIRLSVPWKSVSVQSIYGGKFVRKLCWKYSDKPKYETIKSEVNKQELLHRHSTFKASLSRNRFIFWLFEKVFWISR